MIVKIERQVRKNYAELSDGSLVEIKNIIDPSQYDEKITVYENKLAKGARAGESEFSVAVEDYKKPPRAAVSSIKLAILEDVKNGMSIEELTKKYNTQLQ
jgi:Mor family transcriptional regulator